MPKITFLPMNKVAECDDGRTVFSVGQREGVPIDTSCVGKGTCGRCRVKIVAGEEFLPPVSDVETKHLGNVYFITKERLSCQCVVAGGDVTVEVVRTAAKPRG